MVGQPQSISSAPASVTHVYTAVGNYAISATATVSDGQGGTYTAVTGGTAGALDSSFGAGVAQVDSDGSHRPPPWRSTPTAIWRWQRRRVN